MVQEIDLIRTVINRKEKLKHSNLGVGIMML